MKFSATSAALAAMLALAGASALAQGDPVEQRIALMKDGVAANIKISADMVKGAVPFDAAKAEAAMKEVAAVPDKFLVLLHEGTFSDSNSETTAKPEVMTEKADFEARMAKLEELALAAAEAASEGPDQFKAAFAAATQECRGCHEKYRIKR